MNRDLINDLKNFIIKTYNKKFNLSYLNESNIPNENGIFVFNHGTANDGPIVNGIADYLGNTHKKKGMRYSKMLSASDCLSTTEKLLFHIMNWIPVDRMDKNQTREGISKMVECYNKGYDLILFPEGTWNTTSNLVIPFYKGVGETSYRANCPIFPCGIFRKNETDYYINVGEVINPDSYVSLWADNINAHLKEIIDISDNKKDLMGNLYRSSFFKTRYKELVNRLIYRLNRISRPYDKELVYEILSKLVNKTNVNNRIDMYLERISEPNAFSDFFLDVTLNNKLNEEINNYLKGNLSRDVLKKDLTDYIVPIELTNVVESNMASLYGSMMFDEKLQNKVTRKDNNPDDLLQDIIKEENGFQMDYEKEVSVFRRKKKNYYNYLLNENKDYITEEEVFSPIKRTLHK